MANDFNWVEARLNCCAEKVFAQLQAGVTNDVATINEVARGAGVKFEVSPHGLRFLVIREGKGVKKVQFVLEKNVISVLAGDQARFSAAPTMNPAGQCVLIVNGQEMEPWQVRRMALEQLFFEA
jgi:hypothetical protein